MSASAVVVIPLYRETLDKYEEISLTQALKVFKNRELCLAVPKGLVIKNPLTDGIKRVCFPASYFANVNGYSTLMRSEIFYTAFSRFDYILIAQLDTFVFSDRLDEWTAKGYDYTGAPWLFEVSEFIPDFLKKDLPALHRLKFMKPFRRFSKNRFMVGNGGFSLRKTSSFLRFLRERAKETAFYNKESDVLVKSGINTADNEDAFWAIYVPARDKSFKIPGYKEALGFAFETNPGMCYRLNNFRLPFGCHGWEKHNINFWKKYIKNAGYDPGSDSGGGIDRHSGFKIPLINKIVVSGKLKISGWFTGPSGNTLFEDVFVTFGDKTVKAFYGMKRENITEMEPDINCGFTAEIPIKDFKNGKYPLVITGKNPGETISWKYPSNILVFNKPLVTFLIRTAKHLTGYVREPKFIFSLLKNISLINKLKSSSSPFMLVSLTEHLGDIAACEPAVGILTEQYPGTKQFWVVNYRYADILKYDKRLGGVLEVTSIFEWSILKNIFKKEKIADLHIDKKPCSKFFTELNNSNSSGITLDNYYNKGNLLNAMLQSAGLEQSSAAPVFHFDPEVKLEVLPNTIVMHCSSNENQRNWDDEKWAKLSAILISKGFNLAEIGFSNRIKNIKAPAYTNYCGILSLQQIALLIKKSVLFVGIDSGFAHFANSTGTPGVILLGHYRDYKKYMPYSGGYQNGSTAEIIQHEDYVKFLPVETVLEKIEKRLKK